MANNKKTKNKGLVYVFTGDGKGKTSAALWTAVRALMQGERVAVVQFYKEVRWPTAIQKLAKKFKNLELYLSGRGFYKLPTDHSSPAQHKKAARAGFIKAKELIKSQKYFLVILDESMYAVGDRLIKVRELVGVIKDRGRTHIVLTGRGLPKTLLKMADLVTDVRKLKHPFDKGVKAVKGLDF